VLQEYQSTTVFQGRCRRFPKQSVLVFGPEAVVHSGKLALINVGQGDPEAGSDLDNFEDVGKLNSLGKPCK
jgi:hypothetical protein